MGPSPESVWLPARLGPARYASKGTLEVSRPARGAPAAGVVPALSFASFHAQQISGGGTFMVCLGASFWPLANGRFTARALVSQRGGQGLDDEVAPHVVAGAAAAAERLPLAAGELTFDLALQNLVDTKAWRFGMAAATIASFLQPGLLAASDEAVEAATTEWLEESAFFSKTGLEHAFVLTPGGRDDEAEA